MRACVWKILLEGISKYTNNTHHHHPTPSLHHSLLQTGREYYRTASGRFGPATERCTLLSAAFVRGGWLVTGTDSGSLLQWDAAQDRQLGKCVRVSRGGGSGKSLRRSRLCTRNHFWVDSVLV